MKIAPLPVDEDLRLQDLYACDLLDSEADEDFDALVELASQLCKTPISLITLLDETRQWFKANKGLACTETPRDQSFCSHTILQEGIMIVEDALLDERFHDNPLVTGETGIRFYAGTPILSPSGQKLGALCIIDQQPKKISEQDQRALVLLSQQATRLLALRSSNKRIRDRAEEIIDVKSRAINQAMRREDEHKRNIAFNLHEDLAQRIAASLLYLNMAEDNLAGAGDFISTTKKNLNDVLHKMRELSYQIAPPSIQLRTVKEQVLEFAERIAPDFPFDIRIAKGGSRTICSVDLTVTTMRILEEWLHLLPRGIGISTVTIALTIHQQQLNILLEDDGLPDAVFDRQKEVVNSLLYDRVASRAGTLELLHTQEGNNQLRIRLPLEREKDVRRA